MSTYIARYRLKKPLMHCYTRAYILISGILIVIF